MTEPAALDVHSHFLPSSYRAALDRAGVERPDGFPYVPQWSAASAIALMDEIGIAAAVLSVSSPGVHFLPAAQRPALARTVNEEGAAAVAEHARRLGLFASLPLPDVDAALEEIAYARDSLDADGFVLMTNYDGVYLGDPQLEPVMDELERREAIVALHPTTPAAADAVALGRPRPMIEFMFDTTRAVVNLILNGTLRSHPKLRVIVPHLGSALPAVADRVHIFANQLLVGEGEAVDVYAELRELYFDVTGAALPNTLPGLLRIANPARILYGSDTPFGPPQLIASGFHALNETDVLDDAQRRMIFSGNAHHLFPRFLPERS
jgi:predicted TIM-barrel fold metal-dependent hydrolase